jgi:hypothetical protein
MMRENCRKIVTPDGICPALEQGFDQGFVCAGLFGHGVIILCCVPRTHKGQTIRHRL